MCLQKKKKMTETSRIITSENIEFDSFKLLHGPQLQTIPERFWETLFEKLRRQVFDAGEMFTMLLIDYSETEKEEEENEEYNKPLWKVVTLSDIMANDGKHIYLIDHAWTYDVKDAENHLKQIPSLADRMASLMNIPVDEKSADEIIQEILNKMWLYNQVYSFGNKPKGSDEAMPLWYVMDEFGSRLQHSDDPSCSVVPFYYVLDQLCYSVIFPLKDLQANDEVSRNYLQKQYSGVEHSARLIPWQYSDLTDIDYIPKEPSDAYFYEHCSKFILPDEDEEPFVMNKSILKVYIDYDTMEGHLSDPRFVVVDDRDSADVLFVKENLKNFKNLHQFVNQFPNESLVTVKDLLAVTGRRSEVDRRQEDSLEYGPSWLPVTYNLNTELPQFVSYFQHRKKRNLDNIWICKPWNLARALDTHITDQLPYIVRLQESGPKVACKYIEDPLLINFEALGSVKFDIRYIVLLRSVKPLKLYAYQCFFLRFSNKEYSLDSFNDYQKHFTVMNYDDNAPLRQINYDEFIPLFNCQYSEYTWADVEKDIFKSFRSLFLAATKEPFPRGMHHSPQSRAMYGIDLMLKWGTDDKGNKKILPVICEVNFVPDCYRANKYHPSFTNDVFSCLFLDDIENRPIVEI